MEKVTAKVLMVMNRRPDKDSPGQGASEIIDILVPKYFTNNQLHVILDEDGDAIMKALDQNATEKVASVSSFKMSGLHSVPGSKTHDPVQLARAISKTFFKDYVNSDYFVFDYDDTLVGRGNVFPNASAHNVQAICRLNSSKKIAICTGNSIKAIKIYGHSGMIDPTTFESVPKPLTVFADGGVNKYSYSTVRDKNSDDGVARKFEECVDRSVLFQQRGALSVDSLINLLKAHHIPLSKIENRGGAMISIKPIDQEYRPMVIGLIKMLLNGSGLQINAAGRTTIEIHDSRLSKAAAIRHIMETENPKSITYVGDELDYGNDACVNGITGVKCLKVKSPVETAFFLLTLSNFAA